MNPNHPHYAGLGGGPNLNLLDNMLMAAGFQATDQPVVPRTVIPQYTYAQEVSMQHHALNLGQTHTTMATSAAPDPVHVIVYQQQNEQQQQQPISYKIPQLGTVVHSQEQNFVVNDQGGQIRQTAASTHQTEPEPVVQQATAVQSIARQVQSPAERRKDIVAQAMQEQKIYEETVPKQEVNVKQEPGVAPAMPAASAASTAAASSTTTASTTATPTTSVDTKPNITATKSTPATDTPQRRQYQKSGNYNRQHIVPRLQILDDEDDGLTCRMCLASYWYKAELLDHLKTTHSITDPDKYEKEEREKKMRRMREEQQRVMMAKKQREERERRLREAKYGRGRAGMMMRGMMRGPGQRPSFQYRDGAFICDLCKESFSDGNDMVTHWKSHVKKQQADMMRSGRGRGRGRPPMGYGRGRGRPSLEDRDDSDSSDSSDDDDDGLKRKKKKGMPRWTAYLLWSTRKRRDVVVDHPEWGFAQIAKWISDEWKKVDADEKDELQKEAEEMNELGIRKLPRDDDDDDEPDFEKDTTDEDSDFEEGYRRKQKPIMLKIKKEKGQGDDDEDSDESDWEPEAEIKPPTREPTRSGRQRKRPSFFQEFESQENNLDSILEQFEKQQAEEFGKPKLPKVEKPESEKKPRKPRKRKEPDAAAEAQKMIEQEVEVLRSGRKRKVRKLMTSFMNDGSDEDDKLGGASSEDEDFEPPAEDEIEKIEEHDDQLEGSDSVDSEDLQDEEDDDDDLGYGDMDLPPKKRGRPKKLMTDEEIEEATRTAANAKPSIEIIPVGKKTEAQEAEKKDGEESVAENIENEGKPKEDGADESKEREEDATEGYDEAVKEGTEEENKDSDGDKVKPPWVKETLTDSEDEGEKDKEPESLGTPAPMESLDTPAPPLDTPAPLDLPEESGGQDNEMDAMDTLEQPGAVSENNEAVNSSEAAVGLELQSEVPLADTATDLLVGSTHNLDDQQFKADTLEANLEDIFK